MKILEKVNQMLEQLHFHPTVPASIDGEEVELNEYQVRALQVLAKRAYQEGNFEEFCKNTIVYSDSTKKTKMIFREDGNFENSFECGFYDVINNLLFEIL